MSDEDATNGDDPEMARVISVAGTALAARMAPSQVVTRAGTMLRMVQLGLSDMQEADQDRILLGFLGVVVFGRSVTLVMQNLRTHDKGAFDQWYAPWRAEMRDDPLMCYFSALRTAVVHHSGPAIGILLAGYGAPLPPIGSISVDEVSLPQDHLGQPLDDTSMVNLCRLYVAYLERVFESFAPVAFAVQDRLLAGDAP